jgi:hypothetical protein
MPHVAIAQGDDPLFLRNKEMIGHFLWTPEEAYALAFPDNPAPAGELRVISYILPQTPETRTDQRLETTVPAERWARSRFHGEEFNCDLRLHLAESLTQAGYLSVAPERLPDFGYQQSERFGLASNGHDKQACFTYIRETTAPFASSTYGTGATPCGLCQVKIPCEAQVPPALLEKV